MSENRLSSLNVLSLIVNDDTHTMESKSAFIVSTEITDAIRQYVDTIETEESKDWCVCEWETHPTNPALKRRKDTSLDCPCHSREGLILGFLKWLANRG